MDPTSTHSSRPARPGRNFFITNDGYQFMFDGNVWRDHPDEDRTDMTFSGDWTGPLDDQGSRIPGWLIARVHG